MTQPPKEPKESLVKNGWTFLAFQCRTTQITFQPEMIHRWFSLKKNAVIIIIVFELHFTRKLFTILCYKRPLQQKPPRFLHCWWQCNDKFRYNWGLKTWFGPNLLPSLVRGHLAFEWKRFDHHLKKIEFLWKSCTILAQKTFCAKICNFRK